MDGMKHEIPDTTAHGRSAFLRATRFDLGWTQQEMTVTYVGLMERGQRPVSRRTDLAVRYLATLPKVVQAEFRGDVLRITCGEHRVDVRGDEAFETALDWLIERVAGVSKSDINFAVASALESAK